MTTPPNIHDTVRLTCRRSPSLSPLMSAMWSVVFVGRVRLDVSEGVVTARFRDGWSVWFGRR